LSGFLRPADKKEERAGEQENEQLRRTVLVFFRNSQQGFSKDTESQQGFGKTTQQELFKVNQPLEVST
jgi:hypothetical protein